MSSPVSFYSIPTSSPGSFHGGEYPGALDPQLAQSKIQSLLDSGITHFIDLTHPLDRLKPYAQLLPPGAKHLPFPIIDQSIPDHPHAMKNILDAIDRELALGHNVYLHCWGGRGRTGAVAACFLKRHGDPDALATVGKLWKSTPRYLTRGGTAPENESQFQFVRDWVEPKADDAQDRARGALLGLAIGDAVGAAVEFMARGTFEPVTDLRGGGPHGLKPGQWTDDTSMALCLADSLIEKNGFDARDQMTRYVAWKEVGYRSAKGYCFDIGNTVSAALSSFKRTGNPFAGSTDPYSAGNGSIMRLAPIPLRYFRDLKATAVQSRESSRTTHGAATCLDACALLGVMIARAIAGESKESVLAASGGFVELQTEEIRGLARQNYRGKSEAKIRGSGYVVESLEAALWCIDKTSTFKEAVLLASNLGDDADTTAAVVGQLAGALYGGEAIPKSWLELLFDRHDIERVADALFEAV